MTRARDLCDDLIARGELAIDELIQIRASEELFLDFKRSSDDGASQRLSQTDRNNLAKAISGFGNSSGGVIIWGVDCSSDVDGADVAKAKHPIQNVARFVGNLQGAVSGCTIPPHGRVEHHAILDGTGGGSGYVVSYIPESDHAPHQVVGRLQYYIRAGSDFVPAPHQVLAGMFGRRPQPNMFHMFTVFPARSEGESIICKYEIVITNGGPGIARDLFFTAMVHSTSGDNTNVAWSIQDRENWTGNFSFGRQLSIMSKPTVRVPPSAFLIPLSLVVNFRPPFMDRLTLKGNIGCTGSPTMNIEIDNDPGTISRLYDEYFVKLAKNETPQNYCHQLAVELLNIAENVEAKK